MTDRSYDLTVKLRQALDFWMKEKMVDHSELVDHYHYLMHPEDHAYYFETSQLKERGKEYFGLKVLTSKDQILGSVLIKENAP